MARKHYVSPVLITGRTLKAAQTMLRCSLVEVIATKILVVITIWLSITKYPCLK